MARLAASTYLTADEAIVWLGPVASPLHPRAILSPGVVAVEDDAVAIDVGALMPWRPRPIPLARAAGHAVSAGWRRLTTALAVLGAPSGFGARLVGAPLAFP